MLLSGHLYTMTDRFTASINNSHQALLPASSILSLFLHHNNIEADAENTVPKMLYLRCQTTIMPITQLLAPNNKGERFFPYHSRGKT